MKNQPFHRRIGFAVTGIIEGWRSERSFRAHVFSAVAALGGLTLLRPAPIWWALIILVVAQVLVAELINAAFEGLIDHLHPGIHPRVRIVKDMAAGAVLIAAIASLFVAAAMVLAIR